MTRCDTSGWGELVFSLVAIVGVIAALGLGFVIIAWLVDRFVQ